MTFKPNVSVIAAEAYLLFCYNKTASWLGSKSEEERRQLVNYAQKGVKSEDERLLNGKKEKD